MKENLEESHETELPLADSEVDWLKAKFPVLHGVDFKIVSDPFFEGGIFNVSGSGGDLSRPEIMLRSGGHEKFEEYKNTRPEAVLKISELLHVAFEQIDGAIIRNFVLFHEAGHAYDFLWNYVPSGERITDAGAKWQEELESELASLPFPGLAPAELIEAVNSARSFDEWRTSDQFIAEFCEEHNINSLEELLKIQEVAYRKLPREVFADIFAKDALAYYAKSKSEK